MARADLLLSLVRAATQGEQPMVRRAVEAMAADARAKHQRILADRLLEVLAAPGPVNGIVERVPDAVAPLFTESCPDRQLSDLILPEVVRMACGEVVEEHQRADLLRSYGLEPRHRIVLAGPPGTGKTSVAAALAAALMMPMLTVRYEGVIGSYLGETASRLDRLFAHARSRRCVLFFDEFDTLGKERGDVNETGEIKRVVSSLLLQVDALPSHVLVVAASNHPELLDRAAWRRFQVRLQLPLPTAKERIRWFAQFQERSPIPLKYSVAALARATSGASYAEIEELGIDFVRRMVLAGADADPTVVVRQRLEQWKARVRAGDASDPVTADG